MLLDRPVKVEESDFDDAVKKAEIPVLVDFYADWCQPCRMVAPVLDEIAHAGIGRLLVAKVDTDRAPTLGQQLQIRSIPTLILFQDGHEVERIVGVDVDRLQQVAARLY